MKAKYPLMLGIVLAGVPFSAALSQTETTPTRVRTGTLTCMATTTKEITEPVLRRLSCTFEAADESPKRSYEGEIIHHGPNATLRSGEVLVWNVWMDKDKAKTDTLIGKYYGIRQDDPSLPGLGANTLAGNKGQGTLLEPVINPGAVKVPGKTLAVTELELRPARI